MRACKPRPAALHGGNAPRAFKTAARITCATAARSKLER